MLDATTKLGGIATVAAVLSTPVWAYPGQERDRFVVGGEQPMQRSTR